MISIIIPTFNRAEFLTETLDSIWHQSMTKWECLIVDDGSTDNSWEILENYSAKDSRFKIFKRSDYSKPKGANACRNIGIQESKGEFLYFFDSDDLLLPNALLEFNKLINSQSPDLALLASVYFGDGPDSGKSVMKGNPNSPDLIEAFFKKEIVWLTHNPVISKDFLVRNQIDFDESLQAGQDWEFFMKVLLNSPQINSSEFLGVKMRIHAKTISRNEEMKLDKYFHYYLARNKIFHQQLSVSQKTNLNDYYQAYIHSFLTEFLKFKRFDLVNQMIENESNGIEYLKNKIYLFLYKMTGKGISKIRL